MKVHGRKTPYTEIGIRKLPCVRCGAPSTTQWSTCAEGLYRPICLECDIAANRLILCFMGIPGWAAKAAQYATKKRNEGAEE